MGGLGESDVHLHREGEILWIELAGRNNTIGSRLMSELHTVLNQHRAEPSLKVLALTGGGGKFFCPGLDLMEVGFLTRPQMADFMGRFRRLYLQLFTHPKPTLAAINGHALAGGAILAGCCDYRLAKAGARVGLTELNQVVPVPYGSLRILGQRIASLREAAFLGRNYTAGEALARGWVDEVVEGELFAGRCHQLAEGLRLQSSSAFEAMKSALVESPLRDIERREPLETERFLDCWFSEAAQAKIRGLLERLVGNR